MTSVPRWEPDGTESPAERTDPLLPAITDDMLPPLDLPRLPTLDDRTLAQMLAELDGDDPTLTGDHVAAGDPAGEPAATADPVASPVDASVQPGSGLNPALLPAPGEPSLRLLGHPAASATGTRTASPAVRAATEESKYVRRDLRAPSVHPDALTLTGLTRRSRSHVGSILFKAVFVGIFLLILFQAIVSLLTPGT